MCVTSFRMQLGAWVMSGLLDLPPPLYLLSDLENMLPAGEVLPQARESPGAILVSVPACKLRFSKNVPEGRRFDFETRLWYQFFELSPIATVPWPENRSKMPKLSFLSVSPFSLFNRFQPLTGHGHATPKVLGKYCGAGRQCGVPPCGCGTPQV